MGAQTMAQAEEPKEGEEVMIRREPQEDEMEEATQTPSSWTDSQGNSHPATKVQGKSYGNQDRETEEEEDDEVNEASVDMSAYDFPEGGQYGYKMGTDNPVGYGMGHNSQGLTVIDKQTGKTVHHNDFTYFDEEPTQEELAYWFNEPVTGEDDKEVEESILALRKLAGIGEGKKPDFLDVDKDGNKEEPMTKALADKEEEVKEASGDAEDQKQDAEGEAKYNMTHAEWEASEMDKEEDAMAESSRILKLAGVNEWANSPEDKAEDTGTTFDKLPSAPGKGAGHPDFGQNRANNQGENPMAFQEETVEEAFDRAMGEYRKFVSESIAAKK